MDAQRLAEILAIDPGTDESGWVLFGPASGILDAGIDSNDQLIGRIRHDFSHKPRVKLAVEMIASYGMPVGREVFETCVWIGKFIEAFGRPLDTTRVTRNEVKNHLCGTSKAKDANVRQALIDMFGSPGTKKDPGPTHGVKSHMWAALGVAATVLNLTPTTEEA